MCGIAALINSERPIAELLPHLNHRGPDNSGVWQRDGVQLAHTRLSLLDLSAAGDQPMESDQWVITYNGELYNHLELVEDYGLEPRGPSDTATLLALIELLGVRATLPLLRGMWAFAAYDKLTGILYCATDPFGIKPLHWYAEGEVFACASTPSALLPLKRKWKLNYGGMLQFLTLGGSDGVWQGINRLPGGTLLTYRTAPAPAPAPELTRWYTPKFHANAEEVIEAVLHKAMQQVQLADVPVGLFYSGGVDSSVVASHMPPGTHAFHLNGPEVEYARKGAAHFGFQFHVVNDDKASVANALRHVARATGEPTMAGHIPYLVSQYAAEYVKAAISANGADELFFGYPRTLEGQDKHLFRSPDSFSLNGKLAHKDHEAYLRSRTPQAYSLRGNNAGINAPWPACANARWVELMYYVQYDLNPTLDAASMAHSLEMRVPFLDQDLVECALSLPHAWHGTKRFLRDHLATTGLPTDVYERPKLGFSMATGDSPAHVAYQQQAIKHLAKHHGFAINKKASGRDKAYLTAAAAGWYAFEQEHEHLIER